MDELGLRAAEARSKAYAPYSGYPVGAAIESSSSSVFVGCNVENVSFGATMCAERVALGAMVASGEREVRRIAIATRDGALPCGICLQSLAEFAPMPASCTVVCWDEAGNSREFRLDELSPRTFSSGDVRRFG